MRLLKATDEMYETIVDSVPERHASGLVGFSVPDADSRATVSGTVPVVTAAYPGIMGSLYRNGAEYVPEPRRKDTVNLLMDCVDLCWKGYTAPQISNRILRDPRFPALRDALEQRSEEWQKQMTSEAGEETAKPTVKRRGTTTLRTL